MRTEVQVPMTTSSKRVALREITKANFHECIRLKVAADQAEHVAPNVYSLAQAKVNPLLHPFAIYDGAILGRELRRTSRWSVS